jgi:hypothetical protein
LLAEYEHKHVALLALSFREHTFEGEDEPTQLVEVAVVDVETDPVRLIAALSISYRSVVLALRLAERGTWQIGKLERPAGSNGVELRPPEPTVDLERVAAQLGALEFHGGARPLALTSGKADAAETDLQNRFAALESATGDASV